MLENLVILASGVLLSFLLTTFLIRWGIPRLEGGEGTGSLPESGSDARLFNCRSTGFWIGLCETLLVFTFVYLGQFGALAIIIGAKQFVRKDDIRRNPSYYLLGTLINISLALLFALGARALIAG